MAGEISLYEHITNQIHMAFTKAKELIIADRLLHHLDASGYLRKRAHEVAKELGCSTGDVRSVLLRMQRFDPTGVFARDLQECLALQMLEKGAVDEPMKVLLENLHLIESGDLPRLRKLCDVDRNDFQALLAELRGLNPKPGLLFEAHFSTQRVPDVTVRRSKDMAGGAAWVVELNHETLPKLIVNQRYYAHVQNTLGGNKETQYLNDKLTSANWLVRALDQRAQTILKVASEIVSQQDAFFTYGVEYLKPMVLRDVAKEIDVHESTVSRVTSNKYIATPRGVFELKYFFSSGLSSTGGLVDHAAEAVKARIKDIISKEAESVLSDDTLAERLKGEGIDIARRTVAKYREALGIGSSVERRRALKRKRLV